MHCTKRLPLTKYLKINSFKTTVRNLFQQLTMGGVASVAFKDPVDIDQKDKENVLDLNPGQRPDLESIAKKIKSGDIQNIVCLCGAGISVSCGIPDFRSEGTGLYHNLQKYDLDTPESIFDIEFFRENPRPFIHLAKELFPGQYKPSPTHYFMKLLHDKNKLLRVYTQNIDGLEFEAGLNEEKVIQCHGGFQTSHCINCDAPCDNDRLKRDIMAEKETRCEKCSHLCKPGITFFGEALPKRYHDARCVDFARKESECCSPECRIPTIVKPDGSRSYYCPKHSPSHDGDLPVDTKQDDKSEVNSPNEEISKKSSEVSVNDGSEEKAVQQENVEEEEELKEKTEEDKVTCAADLLIIMGTSLMVAPVASLADEVHWLCPRVLINREKVHVYGGPKPEWPPQMGPDNGFRFDEDDNYRDVACLQDCDEGTRQLAVLLGWERELDELIAAGAER